MMNMRKRRSLKYADYYLTAEVADILNVNIETVKKWEKMGIIPKAQRDPKHNWRLFDKEEIKKYLEHQKE